jgi:pSer/pThr/pTyr-binding forkhead associated (FHA) protein
MDNTVLKQAELILIRADGSEGRRFPLDLGENLIGRDNDAFSRDAWISPRHARFTVQDDKVVVEDLDSLNGVFVRIPGGIKLLDGAHLRIGLELLRYREVQHMPTQGEDGTRHLGSGAGPELPWGRLARIIGPDEEADAWLLHEPEISIGRDRGDIVFPQDAFVSGSHARLKRTKDGCVLEDMGSSNGTYLKIPGRWELKDSDVLLLGQQIVRLSMR